MHVLRAARTEAQKDVERDGIASVERVENSRF